MREFKPKIDKRSFPKRFLLKYVYLLVIGVSLLFGVSYSATFFVQNKTIATGSLSTGSLTVTFTDGSINARGLLAPENDHEGLKLFSKSIVINNTSDIGGIVELSLDRISGISLSNLNYAVIVNNSIVETNSVPNTGKIYTTAIMANDSIDVEVRLWPDIDYLGDDTFVGNIETNIKYFGEVASDNNNLAGKYVNFNCNGNNCEVWRIVKIEDGRLVLTRQSDYSGATGRVNSHRYNPNLTFNDDSLITSVSTDNKNVYLLRTVKINGGSGTISNPYTLTNDTLVEGDKKVLAEITYVYDDNTLIAKQNIYANQTNYISQIVEPHFVEWLDSNDNSYDFGDVIDFTVDKTLVLHREIWADQLSYSNSVSGFNCADVQCALETLFELEDEN